ncbi:MAG: hypothetical protein KGJ23_13020 [Euryarchaeota archaeon]|nr:hypothetical protein [Euryarchaeota archaeon]MDE1837521.1 hypothetical protein [Euryarchaeota archaeon]
MSLTYSAVIAARFGEREFSAKDLARLTGSERAAKLLSELKHRGTVERVGRGRYRCLRPSDRPDLRATEWARVRSVVLEGPDPKGWTGSAAVEVWTGGRYLVAPHPFLRVFHLAVPRERVALWRSYLRRRGISSASRKRVGASVHLTPREELRVVVHRGEPVIPRREVLALIRESPGLYADAEELVEA